MFYVPELLSLRKRGKLSHCWLAGTLSERMFKSKINNDKIRSFNVEVACNEILTIINSNSKKQRIGFSLYLSGVLMNGVAKLHSYQINMFEKTLTMTLHNLQSSNFEDERKMLPKKSKIDLDLDVVNMSIPEPEPLVFEDLSFRRDVNLLEEVIPLSSKLYTDVLETAMQDFGPLTAEGVDHLLHTDHADFGYAKIVLAVRDYRTTKRKIHRELPDDLEIPQVIDNRLPVDVTGFLPASSTGDVFVHPAAVAPIRTSLPLQKIPRKRPFTASVDDVPPKKSRNREPEIDAANDQMLAKIPAHLPANQEEFDQPVPLPAASPLGQDKAIPFQESQDTNVPQESIRTASADIELPKRSKKKTKNRIDKITEIPNNVKQRLIADLQAHTVPTMDAIAPTRTMRMSSMFDHPTTSLKFGSNDRLSVRQRTYSTDLMERYRMACSGPLKTEYSKCPEILEFTRKNNEMIGPVSALDVKSKSTAPNNGTSVDQTVNYNVPGPVEDAQTELVDEPELETIGEAPLPLAEMTDEHSSENISKEKSARNETVPESKVQFENGNETGTPHVSDPDSQDLDAFLPKTLRGKVKVTKTRQEKTSSEAIIDISSSQSSTRSEVVQTTWTKRDVEACLAIEWNDNPVVPFKKLNPPRVGGRLDAAACFSILLELRKEKKIILTKTDQIYIEKALSSGNDNAFNA